MALEPIDVSKSGQATKKTVTESVAVDFIAAPPPPENVSQPSKKPTQVPPRVRVITYANFHRPPFGKRGRIIQQEYDLREIGKATDTDALLRAAFDRHLTCIMKEGWSIQVRNDAVKRYLYKRLEEIEFMTDLPFDMVLRQCAQDLIEYGNFFLYMHRDVAKSSGQEIRWHGKRKDPIASLYPVDPTTMFPKVGETQEIRSWHQFLHEAVHNLHGLTGFTEESRDSKRYNPEDVVHGYWRRRTGYIFGTPTAIPVLDDIRALRRLEEVAELVAHKHGFPLLHIQVGTEEIPARRLADGTPEVDAVRDEYDLLPLEGAFVTSERVNVTSIDPDSMEFQKLLQHFHDRAMAGLGISAMDLGRGDTANRGSAVVLSQNLMDRCREYQKVISDFLSYKLFIPLVMEGGFDLTLDNKARLVFPDVDADRQMAINNHALALYQGGLVSETEAREIMGRDGIADGMREDMHLERIAIPLAKAQAKAKQEATVAAAANRNQPTNQSGTKTSKTKVTKNAPRASGEKRRRSDRTAFITEVLDTLREELHTYVDKQQLADRVIDDRELKRRFELAGEILSDEVAKITQPFIQEGMDRYAHDTRSSKTYYVGDAIRRRFARRCLAPAIDGLISMDQGSKSDAQRMVDRLRESPGKYHLTLAGMFDSWISRWSRLIDRLEPVAREYGYAQATWIDGKHDLHWVYDYACPSCKEVRSGNFTPAQAHYYGLLPRDCEAKLTAFNDRREDKDVDLVVAETSDNSVSLTTPNNPEYLELTDTNRFLRILLDSGLEAVIPEDNSEGWGYDGKGKVQLPSSGSGVAELWEGDQVVGRTRFSAGRNGRS